MINIPINLWPYGDDMREKSLGRIVIVNDGTGTVDRGNYYVRIFDGNNRMIREGRVIDWPRKSRPVFELVLAGLQATRYKARAVDANG